MDAGLQQAGGDLTVEDGGHADGSCGEIEAGVEQSVDRGEEAGAMLRGQVSLFRRAGRIDDGGKFDGAGASQLRINPDVIAAECACADDGGSEWRGVGHGERSRRWNYLPATAVRHRL